MRIWAIVPVFLTCLHARNDERLTLSIKAQGDFERVFLAVSPALAETSACAQSQAAILSVSAPEEQSLLHYRKGYCLLAGASITRSRQDYSAAAAEFDRAMDAWPARVRKPSKNTPVEPLDNGLRVLDAITHLYAENETVAQPALAAAVSGASCSAGVMTEAACRQWVAVGREWLGRLALRAGKVDEAAADFAGARETGWLDWSQGAQAFHAGSYAASASHYAAAIDTWKAVWRDPGPSFVRRMGPRPDLSAALLDLGAAQLLAGNVKQAESTLDAALKADPASARAFYLRGRARELSGRLTDALSDYNLAARAAFAASEDLASGEAHLYRGILLFRRRDYARAEDEFASALNFSIAQSLRPDAEAWRYLAAVSSGSCGMVRQSLERSLSTVSPFFPKGEARATAAACPVTEN